MDKILLHFKRGVLKYREAFDVLVASEGCTVEQAHAALQTIEKVWLAELNENAGGNEHRSGPSRLNDCLVPTG